MPSWRANRLWRVVIALLLLVALLVGWREYRRMVRDHPERFPWTPLSLVDPIGPFTGRKLAALTGDPRRCRALITAAGLAETEVSPISSPGGQCGYADGIRLTPEGRTAIRYSPSLVTACPVAAALALWERDVVQPAARRHFGAAIERIGHAGSYSCRRLYGRAAGRFSEHATADAIDITGFRIANGVNVSVLRDWNGDPDRAAFLREIRDGACGLFSTVLSPDYNIAHSDHFHLDQAARGAIGWRGCR